MFQQSDSLHLFTREELEKRLDGACSVDWFLREFRIPTRCKGRLVAGADIVHALENPPAPDPAEEEAQATKITVTQMPRPRVARTPMRRLTVGRPK